MQVELKRKYRKGRTYKVNKASSGNSGKNKRKGTSSSRHKPENHRQMVLLIRPGKRRIFVEESQLDQYLNKGK